MCAMAATETRICKKCEQEKPLSEFAWRNRASGLRQSRCKPCAAAANRLSRQRNLQAARGRDRAYHAANRGRRNTGRSERYKDERARAGRVSSVLKARFGITVEQYNEMLERQGNVCAICKRPETVTHKGTVRALAVDHDRETGRVRGLLCMNCNVALGHADDDLEWFERAAAYLRQGENRMELVGAVNEGQVP